MLSSAVQGRAGLLIGVTGVRSGNDQAVPLCKAVAILCSIAEPLHPTYMVWAGSTEMTCLRRKAYYAQAVHLQYKSKI